MGHTFCVHTDRWLHVRIDLYQHQPICSCAALALSVNLNFISIQYCLFAHHTHRIVLVQIKAITVFFFHWYLMAGYVVLQQVYNINVF